MENAVTLDENAIANTKNQGLPGQHLRKAAGLAAGRDRATRGAARRGRSQATNTMSGSTFAGPCSIDGSLAYLEQQAWWQAFRRYRASVPLIDDALWIGQFCCWMQRRPAAIESCTRADAEAFLTTTESFRPGPRSACRSSVTALVDFLSARE
jgi:hypothetical protein